MKSRPSSASSFVVGDASTLPAAPPHGWPELDPPALHGLAGRIVGAVAPHTEADPAALLMCLLVGFGAAAGSTSSAIVEGALHPARLDVVLVGRSAKGRKGTAWARIKQFLEIAD